MVIGMSGYFGFRTIKAKYLLTSSSNFTNFLSTNCMIAVLTKVLEIDWITYTPFSGIGFLFVVSL